MKKKNLGGDMIGIGLDTIFTGIGTKVVQDSNVPFSGATSGLMGAALLSSTSKKIKKYL